MKRILFIIAIMVLSMPWLRAQTAGTLTVTATTSNAGGNYAPRNIVAIWIETEQGNFVKTLLAYAANRKTHLNTWEASTTAAGSAFNVVDAITGATRNSHDTRTCTWDGTDVNGNVVPDGNYKVRMELTDKNATGNFSSFTFVKDTLVQNLAPLNVPSFSSISIVWDPVLTGLEDHSLAENYQIYPNPSQGIFSVRGDDISWIEVVNGAGTVVYSGKSVTVDLSARPDGVYYARIHTGAGVAVKKILLRPSMR